MDEACEDVSAMSISLDQPVVANEDPQELENRMAGLNVDLHLANKKLEEVRAENQQLRMKLQEQDVYETPEVKNIVRHYKNEINDLKNKLTSMEQGGLFQKLVENEQLMKRNQILLSTNAYQLKQLEESERERKKLLDELTILKTQFSEMKQNSTQQLEDEGSQPSKDQNSSCGQSNPAVAEFDKDKYIDVLKQNLKQYYELVIKSQKRTKDFENKNQILEENNRKLAEQLVVIVEERDRIKTMFEVQKQESRSFVTVRSVQPSMSTQESESQNTPTDYDRQKFDHYKNLVIEYKDKCRKLEHEISIREDHNLEQENKIQKLIVMNSEIQKERDAARSLISSQNSQLHSQEIASLRKCIQDKDNHILELEKLNGELKTQLENLQDENQSGEKSLYEEQIKAFQDDYFAEREEKQRALEEKERLLRENENMKFELGNRSVQFSPPGQNPTYEPRLQSPPADYRGHQTGHTHLPNSGTCIEPAASLPNAGHGHQVDYTQAGQMGLHGTIPNSGVGVYHATQMYPGYSSNTIPPRGRPPNQAQMFSPQSPPTDQQNYYRQHPPNYMPNDQMPRYPHGYGANTQRMQRQPQGPGSHNAQNRQTPR